ncbi:MAG: hypothetical protein IJ223_07195 [Clostridia bacterium]|nr:hypothetical protein [Clostridia bacterium]
MIEKDGKTYILQCDMCSNYIDDFFDFQEAVDYKRNNGWKNFKLEREWIDLCPNCALNKDWEEKNWIE